MRLARLLLGHSQELLTGVVGDAKADVDDKWQLSAHDLRILRPHGNSASCGRQHGCFAAIRLDSANLRPYDLTSPMVIDLCIVALFSTHSTRNRASDFRDTVAKDDHRSPRSTKRTSFSASVRP